MWRPLCMFCLLAFVSCNSAQSFDSPRDLGIALTKSGVRCEIDEDSELDPDDDSFFAQQIRELDEAIEEMEEEYNMEAATCGLSEEESALVAVFDTDHDRDEFPQGPEDVFVVGPQWIVAVDSIPTAEQIQEVVGGDIRE